MIPRIITDRLILRGMERADFPAFALIWREPEVVRFIGGAARSESESWGRFLSIAGHWMIEGYGQWAITRRSDGIFLGQTGFFKALRGVGADFDAAPEAGWVIGTAFHGQGYGREAVIAAHQWFDVQEFGGRSHVMISDGHEVSLKLARDMGYKAMRKAEIQPGDRVVLMAREV
ncbi:MAG: GNAT family N-acetyltransferase [Albidovulum sp.]